MTAARREGGFTLVEVLVGVALFALIAAMGLVMLDAAARVRAGTDGRLDHLAALQRAGALITEDLSAARPGALVVGETRIGLERLDRNGRRRSVAYTLEDGRLVRTVAGSTQGLLTDLDAWRWRFHDASGWRTADVLGDEGQIRAVEVALYAAGGVMVLRRVVPVPAGASP